MFLQDLRIREARLFTYVIASADLWYNAVNERTLYLRNDPVQGPVLRGEICEIGPDCHADLGQVLLEYALSCETCQDQDQAVEHLACMGERLGKILATRLYQDAPDLTVEEQVHGAFDFVIRSMGFQAQMAHTDTTARYDLACCPLVDTAHRTGLMQGIVTARRGFIALCESMLAALAPDWQMVRPVASQAGEPLVEIVLIH